MRKSFSTVLPAAPAMAAILLTIALAARRFRSIRWQHFGCLTARRAAITGDHTATSWPAGLRGLHNQRPGFTSPECRPARTSCRRGKGFALHRERVTVG